MIQGFQFKIFHVIFMDTLKRPFQNDIIAIMLVYIDVVFIMIF